MKKALLAILITLTACTFLHAQGEGQKALLNRAYGHSDDPPCGADHPIHTAGD